MYTLSYRIVWFFSPKLSIYLPVFRIRLVIGIQTSVGTASVEFFTPFRKLLQIQDSQYGCWKPRTFDNGGYRMIYCVHIIRIRDLQHSPAVIRFPKSTAAAFASGSRWFVSAEVSCTLVSHFSLIHPTYTHTIPWWILFIAPLLGRFLILLWGVIIYIYIYPRLGGENARERKTFLRNGSLLSAREENK